MKKKYSVVLVFCFSVILSIPLSKASAQEIKQCSPDESLRVLDQTKSNEIESLKKKIENSCSEILSNSERKGQHAQSVETKGMKCRIHTKKYCEQINQCADINKFETAIAAGKTIYQQKLPEIVFKSILRKKLFGGLQRNSNNKICGVSKPISDCEVQFRSAFDIKEGETAAQYVFNNFVNFGHKDDDVSENCEVKLDLNEICTEQKNRLAEIQKCEASDSGSECLNQEQFGIRLFMSSRNSNNKLPIEVKFALEKEFCGAKRVVKNLSGFDSKYKQACEEDEIDQVIQAESEKKVDDVVASIVEEYEESYRPDTTQVKKSKWLSLENRNSSNLERSSETLSNAEYKINSNTDYNLSEEFANSMSENAVTLGGMNKTDSGNSNFHSWSAMNDRFSAINKDIQTDSDKDKNPNTSQISSNANKDSALLNQIDTLKNKLSEMNKKVEELQADPDSKKEGSEEKAQLSENQKTIQSLKSQLASLEKDRKNINEQSDGEKLFKNNNESMRSPASSASTFMGSSNFSDDSYNNSERENNAGYANSASSVDSSNSRAAFGQPSNSAGSSGSSSSNNLILRSNTIQSGNESAIVYMTDSELQTYPYRLGSNASEGEIEKMILGNSGAAIIVGDSEKIVPVIENGAIQYDEKGKIKYKRVKISLVKNEKEKQNNVARSISSIADLKKNDSPKRDIIRYDEMKKNLKLK